MSSEAVINARGLGKAYRLYRRPEDRLKELLFRNRSLGQEFWALRDIDLEVHPGETVGLIGRNGSGKSTLLQLVCGTVQPTTGELYIRGRVAALLELGAGFNPDFTGRENVYLSATVLGLTEAEIRKRFPLIEAFAEIGDFIDQPVRHYSSGMYARLAFAVCAHVDADILVVDEILGVGDAAFQQRCMRFLNAFRTRGALLFVSHDAGAVLSLCDRALWLDQGVVRAAGSARYVCRRYHSFLSQSDSSVGSLRNEAEGESLAAWKASQQVTATQLKAFDFDLDPVHAAAGAGIITRARLLGPDDDIATTADADDEIALCIDLLAPRDIVEPVVGFVLRNRLGQVIFSDTTSEAAQSGHRRLRAGQQARAVFRFRVPHLPTGEYAIEPVLFGGASAAPVDRLLDSLFIQVNSAPHMHGLANVAMRETCLLIGSEASARKFSGVSAATSCADSRWVDRNPMQVQLFDPNAPSHGHGGARIVDAGFFRPDGSRAREILGGEEIELRVQACADRSLDAPIIGFIVRNALGQNVFGENTFAVSREADRHAEKGETLTGHFRFRMPYLPAGDYLLAPSIIDGTQQNHVHLHWIEEALILRVTDSPIGRSVVGVPMLAVNFELLPAAGIPAA